MLRQRLVRQSAVNISSSNESTSMASPPPLRKRRSSQDSKMYRQLSSDSLENLLISSPSSSHEERRGRDRRHSVACGVMYMDTQKPTLKSAFNSAVRRMSDACSLLSSAPSSTYNLSSPTQLQPVKKKDEVLLPQVLGTYLQNRLPPPTSDKNASRSNFQVNRRFSTDCPPPSYSEATRKQLATRQKLLTRQHEVVISKSSLVAVEDDDFGNQEEQK